MTHHILIRHQQRNFLYIYCNNMKSRRHYSTYTSIYDIIDGDQPLNRAPAALMAICGQYQYLLQFDGERKKGYQK